MKTISLFALAAAALLSIAMPPLPSLAQDAHAHGTTAKSTIKTTAKSPQAKGMPHKMGMGQMGQMGQRCEMMRTMHQRMENTTKAQDAKLKQLTNTMNQASETKKVAAMTAVINELVMQRTARQEMQKQHQSKMMGHMGEHMQAGGGKMSMMQCPMMKSGGNPKSKGMMGMGMGSKTQ